MRTKQQQKEQPEGKKRTSEIKNMAEKQKLTHHCKAIILQ